MRFYAIVALLVLGFLPGCAGLSSVNQAIPKHMQVAPVSGGIVGLRTADPIKESVTTTDDNGVHTVADDRFKIKANDSYQWSPALSTGLVMRWEEKDDTIAPGVGLHLVTFTDRSGSRLAPAAAFHYGSRTRQLFVGSVFTATDANRIPGGGDQAIVNGDSVDPFIAKRAVANWNFFVGIVVPIGVKEKDKVLGH